MSRNPERKTRRPQPDPRPEIERRHATRGHMHGAKDALFAFLRLIARHVRSFWGAIAAFLTVGMSIGLGAAAVFAVFASFVERGVTQSFDERVLQWIETRRTPQLDEVMLEITSLGNGAVVILLIAVASIFLWLTHHRWSVYILLVGVFGGQIVNSTLKALFARERPSIVDAVDRVSSQSFPSGHAMAAMIVYGSIAYLVGRLEPTPRLRRATWAVAGLIILAIGISRMYLGVHYPSDIVAGFIGGLAWIAFVAASVTAVQFFAPRRPETEAEEKDLHVDDERAQGEVGPTRHSIAPGE
ncbi:hypothetical protein BH23GEM10_BH23GEM10_07660 [soil metagenome]